MIDFPKYEKERLLDICEYYYLPRTLEHVKRVATFVLQEQKFFNTSSEVDFAYWLAYAHDLYEDTGCSNEIFVGDFQKAMWLITHHKLEQSYDQYLETINLMRDYDDIGRIVWFVKLMDIKDHLTQTETLTDKLKEKYLSGLRYLL